MNATLCCPVTGRERHCENDQPKRECDGRMGSPSVRRRVLASPVLASPVRLGHVGIQHAVGTLRTGRRPRRVGGVISVLPRRVVTASRRGNRPGLALNERLMAPVEPPAQPCGRSRCARIYHVPRPALGLVDALRDRRSALADSASRPSGCSMPARRSLRRSFRPYDVSIMNQPTIVNFFVTG